MPDEQPNNIPVTGHELATRINKALEVQHKRLVIEPGATKYLLVDLAKGKEVDLAKMALELGCREPNEVLLGAIT